MGIVKSEISILTYKRKFIHLQADQVILYGLIGVPSSNGDIPQSPVHTKILATLKHQVMCDAYTHAGVPIPTNKRHATAEVSEKVSGRWRGFNGRFLIIWKQPCLSPIWQER
ncbi:uncharacterized protein [Euphorbia lathyris]|uniref:uncharacterized protein isoform X1 n=1 Tax=Euphorbia lathyris TaxID=212925 RepID=UPI0033140C70